MSDIFLECPGCKKHFDWGIFEYTPLEERECPLCHCNINDELDKYHLKDKNGNYLFCTRNFSRNSEDCEFLDWDYCGSHCKHPTVKKKLKKKRELEGGGDGERIFWTWAPAWCPLGPKRKS